MLMKILIRYATFFLLAIFFSDLTAQSADLEINSSKTVETDDCDESCEEKIQSLSNEVLLELVQKGHMDLMESVLAEMNLEIMQKDERYFDVKNIDDFGNQFFVRIGYGVDHFAILVLDNLSPKNLSRDQLLEILALNTEWGFAKIGLSADKGRFMIGSEIGINNINVDSISKILIGMSNFRIDLQSVFLN